MGIERSQLPQPPINSETSGDPAEIDDKGECNGICEMQSELGQRVRTGGELRERHLHDHNQSDDPDEQRRKPKRRQHDKRHHVGKRFSGRLVVSCGTIAPEKEDEMLRRAEQRGDDRESSNRAAMRPPPTSARMAVATMTKPAIRAFGKRGRLQRPLPIPS